MMMKSKAFVLLVGLGVLVSCTSQKKLAYLDNLPQPDGQETFTLDLPEYKIQPRDVLYITAKAMNPEGKIEDFLYTNTGSSVQMSSQGEGGGFFYGYDVHLEGYIRIPVIGTIQVEGLTLDSARKVIQGNVDKVFKNASVECKLLSFKFTVIGEVNSPGTYVNYNNYLTVLEAIGRAGGIGDFGNRDRVLVIRYTEKGTKTFRINVQDKLILQSEAYFLLPNDVVIVEPLSQKIFNQNLPTISFMITTVLSTITTTLLLIDYFGN